MPELINTSLYGTKFAVIGPDAYYTLHYLSLAGISSVRYFDNYDSFDCREDIDVLFVSDYNVFTTSMHNHTDALKAIGLISGGDFPSEEKGETDRLPVFKSSYSSARSVSEYIIASIFFSLRNLNEFHINTNIKSEVKGKTLGIIGYGKIGSQVSVLAEALGMNVLFYDLDIKLNLGNSKQVSKLRDLLVASDVITISISRSKKMILTETELNLIKPGSSLINVSGYKVFDIKVVSDLLSRKVLNCLIMDLEADISYEENDEIKLALSYLNNVYITKGESYRTTDSLQKISKEVVENVLKFLNAK